jgi:hypothetical protein
MVSEGLDPPRPARHDCDVLVVGGGPGGSAAAYWLAALGADVLCVEKKHFPREKTCGDGLTPRSVRQLREMGLEGALAGHHRYDGLRSMAFHRELEMRWPPRKPVPSSGRVLRPSPPSPPSTAGAPLPVPPALPPGAGVPSSSTARRGPAPRCTPAM